MNGTGLVVEDDPYLVTPELPIWVYSVICFYLFLIGLCGIVFNLGIIILYYKDEQIRTPFHLLLVNLVVTELIVSLYGIPMDWVAALNGGWNMGKALCRFTGFILTLLGMNSVCNLTSIAMFRWIVLNMKDTWLFRFPQRLVWAMIVFGWVWSLGLALPPLFGWGNYQPEDYGFSCAPTWTLPEDASYNIFLFTLGFFCPLSVIIVTSVSVLNYLQTTIRDIKSTTIRKSAMVKHKKTMSMVLAIVVTFVFCWTPYAILSMAGILGHAEIIPRKARLFPFMFAKSSVAWNPIIFVVMNSTFRTAFFNSLPRVFATSNIHNRVSNIPHHTNGQEMTILPGTSH